MIDQTSGNFIIVSADTCAMDRDLRGCVDSEDEIKPGQVCPKCKTAVIDYDGLLNLSCPVCGLVEAGCFT